VKTSQEDFQNKKTPISSPISISTHLEKNKTTRKIIAFDEEKFAEKMFQRVDSQFVPEVVFLYLIPHLPKNPYTNLTSIPPRRASYTEDAL